jgi:Tfp pilus assembly protein PilF
MGQAQDDEVLVRELLAGVESGWSDNTVAGWLVEKNIKDWDLAQWLKENGVLLRANINEKEQLVCFANLGRGALAKAAVEMLQEWEGEDCFNQGNYLYELGRYEEAIASFDRVIELNPDDYRAWAIRGFSLDNSGLYKEAIASYDQVIKLEPDDYRIWFFKGNALRILGRYEEAITSYDQAVKLNPDDNVTWLRRGVILCDFLRLYEKALQSFNQAINIQPICHQAWQNRSVAIRYLKDYSVSGLSETHTIFAQTGFGQHKFVSSDSDSLYQVQINALDQAFEWIRRDAHPEDWGCLQGHIAEAHYKEGINQLFNYQRNPQTYYDRALASYSKALEVLTCEQFPQLRLETLIDTTPPPLFNAKKKPSISAKIFSMLNQPLKVKSGSNSNSLASATSMLISSSPVTIASKPSEPPNSTKIIA